KLKIFVFSLNSGAEVTFWAALFSMTIWHMANFSISQVITQRFLTAPSERAARRALLWSGVGILGMWAALMLVGALLFAYNVIYPGTVAEGTMPDRIFPAFILSALPIGFKGLFIAAAFAAGMSTLSSVLSSMSTISLLDVWKPNFDDDASQSTWIKRARWLTIFWGLMSFGAAFVVLNFGTVVTAGIKLATVIIGGIFGMFLLGLFSRRATSTGAVTGAIAGMITLITIIATTAISWSWYCLIGTTVTVGVGFFVSLFGEAPLKPLVFADLPVATPEDKRKR
uniref:sodium:solute symporter family transporter n=1 Tax=Cephaloticoccus sp. TaxID=1985742 RepID=UPI00404B0B74